MFFLHQHFGAMYTLLDKFLVKLNRIISGKNSIFCPPFYTFFLINLMSCNILFGFNTLSSNWICIERPPKRRENFFLPKTPKINFLNTCPRNVNLSWKCFSPKENLLIWNSFYLLLLFVFWLREAIKKKKGLSYGNITLLHIWYTRRHTPSNV